jgi:hypothetical protein
MGNHGFPGPNTESCGYGAVIPGRPVVEALHRTRQAVEQRFR